MFFKKQKAVIEGTNCSGMLQASNPKLGDGSYEKQEGSPEANVGVTVTEIQYEQSDWTSSDPSLPKRDFCLQAGEMNESVGRMLWKDPERMGNPYTQNTNYWHTSPDSKSHYLLETTRKQRKHS